MQCSLGGGFLLAGGRRRPRRMIVKGETGDAHLPICWPSSHLLLPSDIFLLYTHRSVHHTVPIFRDSICRQVLVVALWKWSFAWILLNCDHVQYPVSLFPTKLTGPFIPIRLYGGGLRNSAVPGLVCFTVATTHSLPPPDVWPIIRRPSPSVQRDRPLHRLHSVIIPSVIRRTIEG